MVPAYIEIRNQIPRDPNGKIARKRLAQELIDKYGEA
jgi:acyl-coenzyme A synthetase/AMP-(fatty) acid ligase